MNELTKLKKGLVANNLANIKGSPFDNAYNLFEKAPDEINLVLLGTNGNMTDAIKSNIDWVRDRESRPDYCHLTSGDWGRSPLRKELMKLPDVLNGCFNEKIFSNKRMILTNGLLLASHGVDDISNQFAELKKVDNSFVTLRDLKKSSMDFFNDYTLSYANPKIIFAYGNSEAGNSAWKYLRDYYTEARKRVVVKIKSNSYKFCSLDIKGKEVFVIGSPHPCFAYNKLNPSLIKKGLIEIGAI